MGSQRTRLARLGWSIVVCVLLVAWWWPGLTGRGSDSVLVSADSSDLASREVIDRRLREEGFTTEWAVRASDDCVFNFEQSRRYAHVVVLLPAESSCNLRDLENSLDELDGTVPSSSITAVRSWRDSPAASDVFALLTDRGVEVVSPHRLIGERGEVQDCLWWDDCPPDGRVATIRGGELTEAGSQRLARLVVAAVL